MTGVPIAVADRRIMGAILCGRLTFLHDDRGRARNTAYPLSLPMPLVVAVLPYELDPRRQRMGIKIGGNYRLDEVNPRHGERLHREAHVPSEEVINMGRTMAEMLPSTLAKIVDKARTDGIDHPIPGRTIRELDTRSKHRARALRTTARSCPKLPRDAGFKCRHRATTWPPGRLMARSDRLADAGSASSSGSEP